MECTFILNGRRMTATREQVEAALREVQPQQVQVHGVEVGGFVYPVKQAFAVAFRLNRTVFSTITARNVFRRLGFRLVPGEGPSGPAPRPTSQAPQQAAPAPQPVEDVPKVEKQVVRLRRLFPHRTVDMGPQETQIIQLPPIVLYWYPWERWDDLLQEGPAIMDEHRSVHKPGVYEARLRDQEERLVIGKAADLTDRVLQGLIKGTTAHDAGKKIRANENVHLVVVRWAPTDRPAAAEEELHRLHIARFARLPKYTGHT
jgi:hypothetical protein